MLYKSSKTPRSRLIIGGLAHPVNSDLSDSIHCPHHIWVEKAGTRFNSRNTHILEDVDVHAERALDGKVLRSRTKNTKRR